MINSKEGWNCNIKNSLINRGGVETLGLPSAHHFFKIFKRG